MKVMTEIERNIIEEEISGLQNIKLELVRKRNSLKLAEITTTDHSQLYSIQQEIKKLDEKIVSNDLTIEEKEKSLNTESTLTTITTTEEKNDITKVIDIFKMEVKDMNYNSSKEDVARYLNMKSKIYDELFKDADDQIAFISSKKDLMYTSALFDDIYSSEALNPMTVNEILKIREDSLNYKWFDRSVIISALSLSLLNFKFNERKANLLLDFLTDFEDKVWERALTGLIISIVYQKNRSWQRATNFINRLKSLQNNDEIQIGLKTIDFILKNELYKANIFNSKIYEIEIFKNPINSFIPFYEDNQILNDAIDNANNEFEVEEFEEYIKNMPFLDSHKYSLCIALNEGKLEKKKLNKSQSIAISNRLTLSDNLSPYQNLISEYYFFFEFFPSKLQNNIFKKQSIIKNTTLKKIILNKVNQLLIEANNHYNDGKLTTAISKFKDILKIDSNNLEAQWQLGNSFYYNGETEKALKTFQKFEPFEKINRKVLYKIGLCYNKIEQFEKSNEYFLKLESLQKYPEFKLLLLIADNYYLLNDFERAHNYCQKSEQKVLDDEDMYNLSITYGNLTRHNDALRLIQQAIKIKSQDCDYLIAAAGTYLNLHDAENALKSISKAEKINKRDPIPKMTKGRILMFLCSEQKQAKELFDEALQLKSDHKGIIHGNIGHYFIIENNLDEAYIHYKECIDSLNSHNDFNKKMITDLELMMLQGISKKEYFTIKDKVINDFLASKENQ